MTSTNCPKCLEAFNTTHKCPVVLTCGHAFCDACTSKLDGICLTCLTPFKIQTQSLHLDQKLEVMKDNRECDTHDRAISKFCTKCMNLKCDDCYCEEMENEPNFIISDENLRKKASEIIKRVSQFKLRRDELLDKVGKALKIVEAIPKAKSDKRIKWKLLEEKKAMLETKEQKFELCSSLEDTTDLDKCAVIFKTYPSHFFTDYEKKLEEVAIIEQDFMNCIHISNYQLMMLGDAKHLSDNSVAIEFSEIPDYLTQQSKQVLVEKEKFTYDEDETGDESLLTSDRPYKLIEDDSVYIGQWKNGKRHGRGEQYWTDGRCYVGYWKDNMAEGRGRIIRADGAVYEGDWKEDKPHGKGVETWPDGAKYEGDYVKGKKEGKGFFKWADGSTYEGEYKNNNIHGQGVHRWSDGRNFDGDWVDNKMHGNGYFEFSDGSQYIGRYRNDKQEGNGEFIWPDGKKYIGDWRDGKLHGLGKIITPDGVEKLGEWYDGEIIRWFENKGNKGNKGNKEEKKRKCLF